MDENRLQSELAGERDDFTTITGIGAGVEKRLYAAGIITFRQLAALSPEEISGLLKDMIGFSVERISNQDWIGEARKQAAERQKKQTEKSSNHQRYAVYTLEFLLDEANAVRRTRVMHVQSQEEESWAGWDDQRLVQYIIQQAGLQVEAKITQEFEDLTSKETARKAAPVLQKAAEPAKAKLAGEFQVFSMETQTSQPGRTRWTMEGDQPITMRLKLDMVELERTKNTPINFLAEIYSKELGTGSRQLVGSSRGKINPEEMDTIDVECQWLSPGMHRLDAFVMLTSPDKEPQPGSSQVAFLDGGLFRVN